MLQRIVTTIVAALMMSPCLLADEEAAKAPNQFHGTWEREFQAADGGKVRVLKIITPTHFAVFRQSRAGQAHSFQSHGGKCEIEGATLTEFYEFSSIPRLVGTSAKSKIQLVEGKLHQTWTTSNGQTVVEVWRRVEQENANAPANPVR